MQKCPICGTDIGKSDIICTSCQEKIRENEPLRREDRIKNVSNALVIFISVFLFLKGAYSLWGMEGYKKLVEEIGFPVSSQTLYYLNASICILAALGYAVTALGNYLNAAWTRRICRYSLLFFLIGQAIIQLGDISEEFITAEAIAVICFIGAVPVLQYVMCLLSMKIEATEAP